MKTSFVFGRWAVALMLALGMMLTSCSKDNSGSSDNNDDNGGDSGSTELYSPSELSGYWYNLNGSINSVVADISGFEVAVKMGDPGAVNYIGNCRCDDILYISGSKAKVLEYNLFSSIPGRLCKSYVVDGRPCYLGYNVTAEYDIVIYEDVLYYGDNELTISENDAGYLKMTYGDRYYYMRDSGTDGFLYL